MLSAISGSALVGASLVKINVENQSLSGPQACLWQACRLPIIDVHSTRFARAWRKRMRYGEY